LASHNSKLCDKCKIVFQFWYEREETTAKHPVRLHYCVDDLIKYAEIGCPICRLLVDSLQDVETEQIRSARGKAPRGLVYLNIINADGEFDTDKCDLFIDFDSGDEEMDNLAQAKIHVVRALCRFFSLC
jgi:phage FluMu protein Com